jgi:hypothetical protein
MPLSTLLIIFILLLFLILVYAFFYRYGESFKYVLPNTQKSIGNLMSRYFGSMGMAFLEGKNFRAEKNMVAVMKSDPFLKHLPPYVIFDKEVYDKMKIAGVKRSSLLKNPNSYWIIENRRAEGFWMAMRPVVHRILETAFHDTGISMKTKDQVDCPVIHFRCSDVPFVKNMHYHFVRYAFYRDCLAEAKKTLSSNGSVSGDRVLLLSCHAHNSSPEYMNKCRIYKASLIEYLEKSLGLQVMTRCGTPVQDFATMFYAPLVLSAGSSFSFMSGFFGYGMFFSEGHFTDLSSIPSNKHKETDGCGSDCGKWLRSGYSLRHNEIDDYEDTEKVIQKLLKN